MLSNEQLDEQLEEQSKNQNVQQQKYSDLQRARVITELLKVEAITINEKDCKEWLADLQNARRELHEQRVKDKICKLSEEESEELGKFKKAERFLEGLLKKAQKIFKQPNDNMQEDGKQYKHENQVEEQQQKQKLPVQQKEEQKHPIEDEGPEAGSYSQPSIRQDYDDDPNNISYEIIHHDQGYL